MADRYTFCINNYFLYNKAGQTAIHKFIILVNTEQCKVTFTVCGWQNSVKIDYIYVIQK